MVGIPEPTEPIGSVGSGLFYTRLTCGLPYSILGKYHVYGAYMLGSGGEKIGSVLSPTPLSGLPRMKETVTIENWSLLKFILFCFSLENILRNFGRKPKNENQETIANPSKNLYTPSRTKYNFGNNFFFNQLTMAYMPFWLTSNHIIIMKLCRNEMLSNTKLLSSFF